MVLKQRFADGRTAYTDIGEQWLYIQKAASEFKELAQEYFRSSELEKECIGLIQHGDRKNEPIYVDFPQWIYSNDGQLFLTLTSKEHWDKIESSKESEKSTEADTEKNMNLISAFIEHLKNKTEGKINIPEKDVLSFFNA